MASTSLVRSSARSAARDLTKAPEAAAMGRHAHQWPTHHQRVDQSRDEVKVRDGADSPLSQPSLLAK
jgi:hypothetical protein